MKSAVLIILVSFGIIGGSVSTSISALSPVFKSPKSLPDVAIIDEFLTGCPDAVLHLNLCVSAANPGDGADGCVMGHLLLDCTERAITANSSCAGAAEATAAVARLRQTLIEECAAQDNSAVSVVAGFSTVITMTCFNLLQ
ncbi:hypothetical protein HA402_008001 [Bradysia odoriphaga]|nr:hypothetical protein HA402_008001 [Bradysia odoriphaga]